MSKILIVDDNPSVLRLLEHTLTKEGYEVLTAKNGIEGLKMASQEVPDLTILDVMLPGIDGFEVCHRLRGEAKTASIPVLMMSASRSNVRPRLDLPQPDSPTSPSVSPSVMKKETPSTALTSATCLASRPAITG